MSASFPITEDYPGFLVSKTVSQKRVFVSIVYEGDRRNGFWEHSYKGFPNNPFVLYIFYIVPGNEKRSSLFWGCSTRLERWNRTRN